MPETTAISLAGAVPESCSPAAISERLSALKARIIRAGGDVARVKILAVTKTFPVDAIRAALEVGICDFGENYADELVEKAQQLRDVSNLRWHFIGAIQRNKLARLAPFASVYEGVTRIEEGRDIARRTPGAQVFVEVDATGLSGRPGVSFDRVPQLVQGLRALDISVEGLMTVAAPGADDAASKTFTTVAALAGDLGLSECSMGMSEDLELAVAAGSTEIRVGTALFGPRADRR
jgi:hypothetical protein